jgi:thiamine phosphate synthase YjbQ (UPF0047 family)
VTGIFCLHVNEPSAQAEVREDQEDLLQDLAHLLQLLIREEFQYKGGHAAVDANEEVDASEHHIGRAGHGEEEGGWVHERRD